MPHDPPPSPQQPQRHPQTGGLLPAEAHDGGLIAVGDALVGCNGYSLQGMDLEQAVGVMRSVGTLPSGALGGGAPCRRMMEGGCLVCV